MSHNIYQLLNRPDEEWTDADLLCDQPLLVQNGSYVDNMTSKERDNAVRIFSQWLKREELGRIENGAVLFFSDVSSGRHFANRYPRFHHIAENLAKITEETYRLCFRNVRNMAADLMQAVVDEEDDYVCLDVVNLVTMDEFLRTAKPEVPYYLGAVCTYHGGM